MDISLITLLDLVGTFAFAISGALAASYKRLDIFGVLVVAFVTALGGGTLRDLLMGQQPVGWMLNTEYLLIVLFGAVFAYLFRRTLESLRRTLFVFDAMGLAVFTILGMEKALGLGLSPTQGSTHTSHLHFVKDLQRNAVSLSAAWRLCRCERAYSTLKR